MANASPRLYDYTVQVWDATNGSNVFTYKGHSSYVNSVAWSPDGKRIASVSWDVQIWDAADGGNVFTYNGGQYGVGSVAWSSDGKRIASTSYKTVQVWDAADGGNVYTYLGHSDVCSTQWHGHPMASASPLAPMIIRCRSGMPLMAATSSPTRAILHT